MYCHAICSLENVGQYSYAVVGMKEILASLYCLASCYNYIHTRHLIRSVGVGRDVVLHLNSLRHTVLHSRVEHAIQEKQ